MVDHNTVYNSSSKDYDLLVSREDYLGNLWAEIDRICNPQGLDVIESGAGTGRLTTRLVEKARFVSAYDLSSHMLSCCEENLRKTKLTNWHLGVASHEKLPIPDVPADLFISGWALCYSVVSYKHTWKKDLGALVDRFRSMLRRGGTLIIIETLGTGSENPAPPSNMIDYLGYLEHVGFSKSVVRTDYQFESVDEAEYLCKFFFGDKLAERVRTKQVMRLPECTGVYHLVT